jgi:regulatory protein
MADEAGRGRRRTAGDPAKTARSDPWQLALKHIAVRARTVHEVRRALGRRGYARPVVAAVIERLRAARYLDDADFARTWVSTRARRGVAAPARLARELREKGVAEAEIAAALRNLHEAWDPAEAAGQAAQRKLKSLQGLPAAVARRRLAAFLDRRGFTAEVILATCRRFVAGADAWE